MKVTISIVVDTPEEAKGIIDRLARTHTTWEELKIMREDAARPTTLEPKRENRAADPVKNEDNATTAVAHPSPRPNVSPKWLPCSKIGTETKEELLSLLKSHPRVNDMAHIGKKMKRTEDVVKSLVMLLWTRNLVNFDGIEFYTE